MSETYKVAEYDRLNTAEGKINDLYTTLGFSDNSEFTNIADRADFFFKLDCIIYRNECQRKCRDLYC